MSDWQMVLLLISLAGISVNLWVIAKRLEK
jgi:hypothetical protein